MLPHSRPWIEDADLRAVAAVLRGEMLAQGGETARFEAELGAWLGAPSPGVAVSSGAAALCLALRALEVGQGAEVILPTYVCGSVRDAVHTAGAVAILADVGEQGLLTAASVAPRVTRRTAAIVVPHLFGARADVAALRTFGVPLVEDCAQALDWPGRWPLAGDAAVVSFHPTKCLTTGEGGLAVAADPACTARMRTLRDTGAPARVLAPLSDLAAALGRSQLARFERALARRRWIAETYRTALGPAATRLLRRTPWERTMHFRFVLSAAEGFEASARAFAADGICVRRGVDVLLHRLEGRADREFPVASELFETLISVPLYPALDDAEVAGCAGALTRWVEAYQSTTM